MKERRRGERERNKRETRWKIYIVWINTNNKKLNEFFFSNGIRMKVFVRNFPLKLFFLKNNCGRSKQNYKSYNYHLDVW